MSELTLDNANFDQLKSIATLSGLDVSGLKEEALRHLIRDTMGQDVDFSLLDREEKPTPHRAKRGAVGKKDKVRLILSEGNGAGGDRPIPVGVNGKIMLVPRGKEVEIPRSYFNVLKDAVSSIVHQDGDDGAFKTRDVASYPFQILAG